MPRILILSCLSLVILSESPHVYCQQLSDEILLNVTVTTKRGNYIKGLRQPDFALVDERVEQKTTTFSDRDRPLSVGILLDRSASMHSGGLAKTLSGPGLRKALAHFFSLSNPSNDYFLLGFNQEPQLLLDWSQDTKALLAKFDALPEAIRKTALYDAGYLALEKVARGHNRKHVLIVISDGQDNASHFTFVELRKFLQESDALVYAVVVTPELGFLMMAETEILDELARISGGMTYVPKSTKQLHEAFERIAIELRNQYTIAFKPDFSANKAKYRRLKVTLRSGTKLPPEYKSLTIRSRQGYYANSRRK